MPVNTGQKLKYFLLDIKIDGCNIATQSRLLTGSLTGIGKRAERGDRPAGNTRSGKPMFMIARIRSRKALPASLVDGP